MLSSRPRGQPLAVGLHLGAQGFYEMGGVGRERCAALDGDVGLEARQLQAISSSRMPGMPPCATENWSMTAIPRRACTSEQTVWPKRARIVMS